MFEIYRVFKIDLIRKLSAISVISGTSCEEICCIFQEAL